MVEASPGPELPPENVFGHTRKVVLFRDACARLRAGRGPLRILDLGCGSGFAVTRFLGEPGDEVLGLDLYAPNVRYAKEHFERPGLTFECRSAATLADSEQLFDVIVLADVLEHLAEPYSVLRECRRLLAPGGMLLVTVPNGRGPFEIESAVSRIPGLGYLLLKCVTAVAALLNRLGPLSGRWSAEMARAPADLPYNSESGHVQFFSCGALAAALSAAGFRIAESRNLSFLSGPFTNTLLCISARFCRWNTRVADRLPAGVVSGWFFGCFAEPAGPAA
jgi:SAM-dependent methyltransferase